MAKKKQFPDRPPTRTPELKKKSIVRLKELAEQRERPLIWYHQVTDGGIRVPMIAWCPKKIAAGSVTDLIGYFGDFMTTCAEMAGAATPCGSDSLSLMPTRSGKLAEQKRYEFLY